MNKLTSFHSKVYLFFWSWFCFFKEFNELRKKLKSKYQSVVNDKLTTNVNEKVEKNLIPSHYLKKSFFVCIKYLTKLIKHKVRIHIYSFYWLIFTWLSTLTLPRLEIIIYFYIIIFFFYNNLKLLIVCH